MFSMTDLAPTSFPARVGPRRCGGGWAVRLLATFLTTGTMAGGYRAGAGHRGRRCGWPLPRLRPRSARPAYRKKYVFHPGSAAL